MKSTGGSGFTSFLLIDCEGAKEVNFQLGYSNIFGTKYQTKGILTGEGFRVTKFRKL